MATEPESPDDLQGLRSLYQEFQKLRVGDTPEEILERTRLDLVEPLAPIESTAEIQEFLDPRTGGRVRSVDYQAAAVAPTGYPADWPFIADTDVQHVRAESGVESVTSLAWSDPDDLEAVVRAVHAAMPALGWHEHPVEGQSADPRYVPRVWFHSTAQPPGHQWRLLAIGEDAGVCAVLLSEMRPEAWPTPPEGEAEP